MVLLTKNAWGLGRRLVQSAGLLFAASVATAAIAGAAPVAEAGVISSLALVALGITQDRRETLRLRTPHLDTHPVIQDELFHQPGNWVTIRRNECFTQRYLHREGNTLCETLMETRGDPHHALALLLGPWTWWGQGHTREYSELPRGATDQILVPVSWYWCHVRMRLLPPLQIGDNIWRIPAVLAGSFAGPATFDVIAHPGTDRLTIRGRFHNVADNVPIFPQHFVTRSHLNAEAGLLPLPFPRGTGWLGLRDLLEARAAEPATHPCHLTATAA